MLLVVQRHFLRGGGAVVQGREHSLRCPQRCVQSRQPIDALAELGLPRPPGVSGGVQDQSGSVIPVQRETDDSSPTRGSIPARPDNRRTRSRPTPRRRHASHYSPATYPHSAVSPTHPGPYTDPDTTAAPDPLQGGPALPPPLIGRRIVGKSPFTEVRLLVGVCTRGSPPHKNRHKLAHYWRTPRAVAFAPRGSSASSSTGERAPRMFRGWTSGSWSISWQSSTTVG